MGSGETSEFEDAGRPGPARFRRKPRESRSRGLRTKTGCLTCRRRHKKCDEQVPVCGCCRLANRSCVYGEQRPPQEAARLTSRSSSEAHLHVQVQSSAATAPVAVGNAVDTHPVSDPNPHEHLVLADRTHPHGLGSAIHLPADELGAYPEPDHHLTPSSNPSGPIPSQGNQADGYPLAFTFSPDTHSVTSDLLTAAGASTRWLDLLASDAAQADTSFSLAPTPSRERSISPHEGQYAHAPIGGEWPYAATVASTTAAATQQHPWQEAEDIVLLDHENILFRRFAEHAASWLDVLDSQKHFSTYAIRLALRNMGLMKAILALSARHAAVSQTIIQGSRQLPPTTSASAHAQAIQYYYETLHYLQTALQHRSYTLSEEILATAIIISTYEMLDESASNWQRHLKGVFWIQRSQDVNGCSGGLRQAVWWAWLLQDIWAAFREKRRCFSFWSPTKDYADLTAHELAARGVYLLSQAVNYAAVARVYSVSGDPEARNQIMRAGDELLAALDAWKRYAGPSFKPLPTPKIDLVDGKESPFQSIWIHPANFAVAIMVYNFARILVTLYRPAEPGFGRYLKMQRTLGDAVAVICGIATALEDEGSQIITVHCLYGAGLCVQERSKREAIMSLIEACERRTGWPMSSVRDDLRAEWQRVDSEVND
ncbi:Zn(II)2Cys6 transcription factor [Pleurostoma richardsiae]|uniref:Zn(II)2Cys6 transcription factor n=1 Tax=Pleurostoma richardsiae TaxID=41990 RepID=A0AA38VHQ6_9PEZI|nr:Zn(II)2Cys6 transcription factor [Pleurostoma richardsiae]